MYLDYGLACLKLAALVILPTLALYGLGNLITKVLKKGGN